MVPFHKVTVIVCTCRTIIIVLLFPSDCNRLPVEPQYLNWLTWLHEAGIQKQLNLYSRISHKWEQIATLLGLDIGEIASFRRDCFNAHERIIAVFGHWFDNARGLPSASRYPKSWQGLINLLEDTELREVAEELKRALSSPQNSVRALRGTLS